MNLHLLTETAPSIGPEMIAAQEAAGSKVQVVRLTDPATQDYDELARLVFQADSVAVW